MDNYLIGYNGLVFLHSLWSSFSAYQTQAGLGTSSEEIYTPDPSSSTSGIDCLRPSCWNLLQVTGVPKKVEKEHYLISI